MDVAGESAKEAKMTLTDMQILIVADDSEMVARITNDIVCNLSANVTIVDSLGEARDMMRSSEFDALLVAAGLPDGDGISLLNEPLQSPEMPVILLGDGLCAERMLTAFRNGATDILPNSYEKSRLLDSIRKSVEEYRIRKHVYGRAKRLRQLSSKLIRDRRELRQRIDLLCRDLVFAYRRLAKKVVGIQDVEPGSDQQDWVDSFDARG